MAEPLWDSVVLSRIRHLHLKARVLTESLLAGEHRSRRPGQSVEFADYQEYRPGMDLRHLDWRVLGRADRLVVRRYETETEIPCAIILDLSGDLATGESGRYVRGLPDLDKTKAGYAVTLAATLAYFLHRHGEPVGLEILGAPDAGLRSIPSRGGKAHLQRLFQALASARPGGVAGLADALARVGARTRRRAWVAVLTDGMEEPALWLPALAAFLQRGADLRFLHLYDPDEWALTFRAPQIYFSPEGGEALPIDPEGAREEFTSIVREYAEEVRGGVVRGGGRYTAVPVSRPLDEVLRDVIAGGASR